MFNIGHEDNNMWFVSQHRMHANHVTMASCEERIKLIWHSITHMLSLLFPRIIWCTRFSKDTQFPAWFSMANLLVLRISMRIFRLHCRSSGQSKRNWTYPVRLFWPLWCALLFAGKNDRAPLYCPCLSTFFPSFVTDEFPLSWLISNIFEFFSFEKQSDSFFYKILLNKLHSVSHPLL